jgi:hypothetical protein
MKSDQAVGGQATARVKRPMMVSDERVIVLLVLETDERFLINVVVVDLKAPS